jgi:hypothetical protein
MAASTTVVLPSNINEGKRSRRRVMFEEEEQDDDEEELEEDDFPILKVEANEDEAIAPVNNTLVYQLTHVVRENKSRPIVSLDCKKLSLEKENLERFLILTLGGEQANVYEAKHMDLASHFVNSPNEYCKECGDLTCGSWILSDPNKNDAFFALGGVDGYVSVISLMESRVVQRLKAGAGGEQVLHKVVAISSHFSTPYVFASLSHKGDEKTKFVVDIWNAQTGVRLSSFSLSGDVKTIGFAPEMDGENGAIAVLIGDELIMFNTSSGKEMERKKLPFKSTTFKFLQNVDNVCGISVAGVGYAYNFQTKEKKTPFVKTVKLTCLNKSTCNGFLVGGDDEGIAYVANLESNELATLKSSRLKNYTVTNCAFSSSDTSNVVCTSHDGTLWRWQLRQKSGSEQNSS